MADKETRLATAPGRTPTNLTQGGQTKAGIGESTLRPDGTLKVTGEFAYSSDMWHEDMLWGYTLRSTTAHAEIRSIDTSEALATSGVYAVLTYDDLPTDVKNYGLEIQDTPVLAHGKVRHHGEPVALVAADHPETARRAAAKIKIDYAELPVVTDEASATAEGAPLVHEHRTDHHIGHVPHPNIVHRQPIIRGNADEAAKKADVIVSGEYVFGMQDQAFLGPESGLAVPGEDGGVDLYVATQWLHSDLRQIAPVLGLPPEKVRMTLSGVGGAFGGREDLSMQIHACLLALRTGKPVKIVYNRFESFFGHVHRHPAKLWYEHGATKDGKLTHLKCRIVLDGGAYASASPAVVGNASSLAVGPYVVDDVDIEAIALYSNNPPCGAMRGFGAVQACFAYEAQMDKVAKKLGMDPVEFRQLNAMEQGTIMPTGQPVDSPAPVAELLRRVKAMPLPPEQQWLTAGAGADVRALPGGLSNTTHGEDVVRGIGYAVGIKNVGFSEGFDDYSTARVRMEVVGGVPVATVHTAMAEVGQGGVTVHAQIARTELGVQQVTIQPADTRVGSAGSTSASRQTYVTGGAVKNTCEHVREQVLDMGRRKFGTYHPAWATAELLLEGGKVVTDGGEVLASLVDVLEDEAVDLELEWRHRPTEPFDLHTGQGNGHVQYSFAAHRAVVEVDTGLGLVKVIELACAQDVGKALNPLSVVGQIQGGTTQGLGVAVMEEIIVDPKTAKVRNPSFTDYLIPTILDTPTIPVDVLELADEHAPYGLRGIGEAPTLSSTPAVLAAIRNATGLELNKTPVRPEHLTGT
ncbi:xanthine dehydrogenase, molybdenum binding subunit apoprotein [Streptomyces sp. 2224.1]|uniref:xanthine dehydrogenase family protein molybdopterin-binding subunit n=1 Tax=unclassified Streptomyces TaxID=2593676 RepID=UPI000881F22C|nr:MULTISPECIES: molybdopterin cofactor-binding domain-containing protein [unclassified Streptomyces]PBC85812.1 xanthine dehydrogenase molybdenum binding subunit apoprotein [Streptomyces sp. 2321.6]SDR05320.1 xanthine dehydrogenase, molybdenum binding subunit apoprotein [Streptomyces sp. KS_16]SED79807.1 xanthine dehydrogenase, molybdenum binding subunit apoprotein [Streptomyces sp. 2133.1]SEE19684.1 xanthine dehydrogenase, molybdenum binding subunit apoprotein [Streptomyces sp. 2224.1]SNC7269